MRNSSHRAHILLSMAALLPIAALADAPPAETGAWQDQKVDFHYMGFTTIYSCDGLQDTLERLLKASGARPDIKTVQSCARELGRPDRMAAVQLKFATLHPSTDAGAVAGVWRHVVLSPFHPMQLAASDCEAVEQYRDNVLKFFTTRNVVNHVTCTPHEQPISFELSFDVFTAAPTPPAK